MGGLLKSVLDLLFPPRCAGCHRRGDWLCRECWQSLPRLPQSVCRRCGRPLEGVFVCSLCYRQPPPFEALRSACYFEGITREMIHRLKYRRARHLAAPLAQLLTPLLLHLSEPVDLIVPVPLFPSRQAARGYNQSTLLAAELARGLNLPVSEDGLRRLRDTPAQIGLSAAERQRNVRGAFAGERSLLDGRRVLLIDDVCTTGATISACAKALKRAGAQSVIALTVARAQPGF